VRKYLAIDHRTKKPTIVDLNEAARITGADSLDITWTLENEGLCETERYTIIEILVGWRNESCTRPCFEPLR
jgi:hypothetical protein